MFAGTYFYFFMYTTEPLVRACLGTGQIPVSVISIADYVVLSLT